VKLGRVNEVARRVVKEEAIERRIVLGFMPLIPMYC